MRNLIFYPLTQFRFKRVKFATSGMREPLAYTKSIAKLTSINIVYGGVIFTSMDT